MASFRTWPDGEVLMLFDMTGVNGDDGTGAIARVLHSESISEFSCFFHLHRGHFGFSHSGSSFRIASLSSRKTYEHLSYRDWVFVPETLRKGKIQGQGSSSTDIDTNIWHLPGVSRALQLDLHIEMKEDIMQEASARNSEVYMNLTIGRLAA
jgi:hypothetical protein